MHRPGVWQRAWTVVAAAAPRPSRAANVAPSSTFSRNHAQRLGIGRCGARSLSGPAGERDGHLHDGGLRIGCGSSDRSEVFYTPKFLQQSCCLLNTELEQIIRNIYSFHRSLEIRL
ncbi:uncharacterized protein LOC132672321 [Panthera onca]